MAKLSVQSSPTLLSPPMSTLSTPSVMHSNELPVARFELPASLTMLLLLLSSVFPLRRYSIAAMAFLAAAAAAAAAALPSQRPSPRNCFAAAVATQMEAWSRWPQSARGGGRRGSARARGGWRRRMRRTRPHTRRQHSAASVRSLVAVRRTRGGGAARRRPKYMVF